MHLVEVDVLPIRNRKGRERCGKNHDLYDLFDKFIEMGVKVAKIEFDARDYHSVTHAVSSISGSAREHKYPIKVVRRGDNVYLVRKDM